MEDAILKQLAETNARLISLLEKGYDPAGLHTKTPATSNTATLLHGTTGLFQGPGLERDVISAHMRPQSFADTLPLLPSVSEDPRFPSITGVSAPIGNQPSQACDDAPTSYLKGCNLTARFGLKRFDTNTIEFDKVMLKVNRGDFTDLTLRGRLLGLKLGPGVPNEQDVLNIVTASEMIQVGVQFERALAVDTWQGTIAAGSFPGLDSQIATGQRDADTATLCPALDSDVKDFAYNDAGGSNLDIVDYLSMLEYYLTNNADGTGVGPAEWTWVMRPQLWHYLTEVWPCKYLTNRCRNDAGTNVAVINDNVNKQMTDDMRRRKVLSVNGRDYPVVLDTGIFEHNNINNGNLLPGQYASSIYFVPLTITGGFPVTYREYVDYRAGNRDVSLLRGKNNFWTDDGIYSWAYEEIKWCYKLAAKTEQRIILRTPWLAGRLDHVRYSPLQHLRDDDPTSPYWLDGGVSLRTHTSGYAVWR